ncbi:hypothetical protein AHAS_Ahas05G0028300 [Arachis hypogaea]
MYSGGMEKKLRSEGVNTCSKCLCWVRGHRCGEQRRRDTWRGRDNLDPPICCHNADCPICHGEFGRSDFSLPDPTRW